MFRTFPKFKNMTNAKWGNLAIAALLVFYCAQIVLDLAWGNLFGNLGVDFAAFWSAGYIANHRGYAASYDLELMRQVQRELVPARAAPLSDLGALPAAYLPVFLLPFQALALLPPKSAAAVWMGLTLLGTTLYLRAFVARLGERHPGSHLLLMLMVSLPVFLNFFLGQVNLWVMICVGEFLLAASAGRDVASGAWLSGMLLKPQLLILMTPAIVMQGWKKAFLGMAAAGTIILGGSWLLAGTEGLHRLAQLWFSYVGELRTGDPQLMMNWRMIGVLLRQLGAASLGQIVAILGSSLTALAALFIWYRRLDINSRDFPIAVLGIMAATAATAWHSHVHMAMILIPPLL